MPDVIKYLWWYGLHWQWASWVHSTRVSGHFFYRWIRYAHFLSRVCDQMTKSMKFETKCVLCRRNESKPIGFESKLCRLTHGCYEWHWCNHRRCSTIFSWCYDTTCKQFFPISLFYCALVPSWISQKKIFLVSLLQSSLEEWRYVFWISFVIFIVTTVIYSIWASGETQPWNYPKELDLDMGNDTKQLDQTVRIELIARKD